MDLKKSLIISSILIFFGHCSIVLSKSSSSPLLSSLLTTSTIEPEDIRIVDVEHHNKTVYSNRNITITCIADLRKRINNSLFREPQFTSKARLVLSLFKYPRKSHAVPIDQLTSFMHCIDPNRTICRAEFDFDIACIEARLPNNYYLGKKHYQLEMACQADDNIICSFAWMQRYPNDCHKTGELNVLRAPRIGQPCTQQSNNEQAKENLNQTCGENQVCHSIYNICVCDEDSIQNGDEKHWNCLPKNMENYWTEKVKLNSKSTTSEEYQINGIEEAENDEAEKLRKADFQNLIKWIVVFLLVTAVILCIALGAVIIWRADSIFK